MEERFAAALNIPNEPDVVSMDSGSDSDADLDLHQNKNTEKFNRSTLPIPSNIMGAWGSKEDADYKRYKLGRMFDGDMSNEYVFALISLQEIKFISLCSIFITVKFNA